MSVDPDNIEEKVDSDEDFEAAVQREMQLYSQMDQRLAKTKSSLSLSASAKSVGDDDGTIPRLHMSAMSLIAY